MSPANPSRPSRARARRRNPLRSSANYALDHPWPLLIALLVAAGAYWYVSTSGSKHTITAVFASGINLSRGQLVQVDGQKIGKIKSLHQENGHAVVQLGIDKDWPLHQGTTAITRFGTTLGSGTRYVQIVPGPKDGPELKDHDIIPEKHTTSAVELDEVFNTINTKTRTSLRGLSNNADVATRGQSQQIGASLQGTAHALHGVSGILDDLDRDKPALSALVTQASGATHVLAQHKAELENLFTVAAATFDEFGTRTQAIQQSLDQFAPALTETRTTLKRADGSLDRLDGLFGDLRPTLRAVKPLLTATRPALSALRQLSPQAVSTLKTLSSTSPTTTKLLQRAQPFSDRLASLSNGLTQPVACLRPYGPEIASFFTQWGSWGQDYDDFSHYARIKGNSGSTSLTNFPPTKTTSFLATQGGGLKEAFVRPPGFNAGQPWFIPDCDYTSAGIDPAQDPDDLP